MEEFEIRGPTVPVTPSESPAPSYEQFSRQSEEAPGEVDIRPPVDVKPRDPSEGPLDLSGAVPAAIAGAPIGVVTAEFMRSGRKAEIDRMQRLKDQIATLMSEGRVDEARSLAQFHFGKKPIAPPEVASPGEKWAQKVTGYVQPDIYDVAGQARSYQRAKGQGPVFERYTKQWGPLGRPGEPSNLVDRLILRGQQAEAEKAAQAAKRATFVDETNALLKKAPATGVIPRAVGSKLVGFGAGALGGGLAGYEFYKAYEEGRKKRYGDAVLSGLTGLGGVMAMHPNPLVMAPGLALSVGIPMLRGEPVQESVMKHLEPSEASGQTQGGLPPR